MGMIFHFTDRTESLVLNKTVWKFENDKKKKSVIAKICMHLCWYLLTITCRNRSKQVCFGLTSTKAKCLWLHISLKPFNAETFETASKIAPENIWIWKAADVWSSLCCTSENHLRVAAAPAVLRRRVAAGTESQCLRVSGFLAQIRRFNGDGRRGPAHWRQLLLLEENAQVSVKGFGWRTDKQNVFLTA